MNFNRREFIKGMAAVTAVSATQGVSGIPFQGPSIQDKKTISFFTKILDGYDTHFMTETLAMAGADSLDLTVRPQGKVEPARVKDDLPKLVEIARKAGLRTDMMVTAIEKPDQHYTKEILETAAELGVKHYRTAWFKYDLKKPVVQSQLEFAEQLRLLSQLNQLIGIQGGYQNHSGASFGSPVWDLWSALKELPVKWMGAQYDVRHAVVEGANSWIIGLNLIKGNISSLAIKDFKWEINDGKASVVSVPLGEGLIDFDLYFKTIKELSIVAPVTLHVEYPLLNAEEEKQSLIEKQKIMVPKIRHDIDFLRSYLNKYEIQ